MFALLNNPIKNDNIDIIINQKIDGTKTLKRKNVYTPLSTSVATNY